MSSKYNQQITILGIKVDKYTDCMWCKKKRAIFDRVAYQQPCGKCRNTKRFEEYNKQKDKENQKYLGMDAALKVNKPAAVWQGRGREIVTNSKGNIIANVPYKERPLGKKDTKF